MWSTKLNTFLEQNFIYHDGSLVAECCISPGKFLFGARYTDDVIPGIQCLHPHFQGSSSRQSRLGRSENQFNVPRRNFGVEVELKVVNVKYAAIMRPTLRKNLVDLHGDTSP